MATPAFQIRVPMDDENTAYWWYRCYTPSSGIEYEEQAPEDIPYFTAPIPQLDGSGLPQSAQQPSPHADSEVCSRP